MKKSRVHIYVNGRDYYSKPCDPTTECGSDIKTHKDFSNYFYENLVGKMEKFVMELDDGRILMLNSDSIKNSIIIVEEITIYND